VSDVFYLEEKEEEEKPRDDLYSMEEEELPMPEYEVEPYEEPSVIEEIPEEEIPEERDIPAEIYPVEKLEEEVPEAVMPDRALVEIPVEVRINLSFCVILPVELLCLTTFVIF